MMQVWPGPGTSPSRAGLLSIVLLMTACSGDPSPHALPVAREYSADTTLVELLDVKQMYTSTGTVVSDQRVQISSRTTAYVRSIDVREGGRVTRRQLLATLDSKDIDAKASIALAERDKAAATRSDAESDVESSGQLLAIGAVSEIQHRKALLQLQTATETLQAANAALDGLQSERQYTRILSPVDGIVVARHLSQGDLARPGTPLITVESESDLLLETHVVETRVRNILIGDPVRVWIDALDQPLSGKVVRVVASGDPVTRTFPVKVSLPATAGLIPGMFGRAEFSAGNRRAMVVPSSALVERGGLIGVYVVDEQKVLSFRWLRTEHITQQGVIVLAGLTAGERIVTAPVATMRDGDRIAITGAAQ